MMKYTSFNSILFLSFLYFVLSFCRLKLKRLKSSRLRFACDRLPVYVSDNLTENVKCILTAECSINVFVHPFVGNGSFDQKQTKEYILKKSYEVIV